MIKREGKYWVDGRNNRWTASKYTKAEAAYMSSTLRSCSDCVDSSDLEFCRHAIESTGCNNCHQIERCVKCTDCDACDDCYDCLVCRDCYNAAKLCFCDSCFDAAEIEDQEDGRYTGNGVPDKYTKLRKDAIANLKTAVVKEK